MPKFQKLPSFADELVEHTDKHKERMAERDKPYREWRDDPTPERLIKAVEHYKSTIDGAMKTIVPKTNPLVERRAQLLAAAAIKSYKPEIGVPLKNHIQQQLSPLRRYSRKVVETIPVPERLRREQAILHRTQEELWDEYGRPPTDDELADRTGISVRMQEKLRRRSRHSMLEGQLMQRAEQGGDDAAEFMPGVKSVDPRQEITDYVYFDLDPVDKLIYQSRVGYRGAPTLSNKQVAAKLGISPAAVSQRASRIEQRIQELTDG